MQNTSEIIRIVLLISSLILMGTGVYWDIKERKYPNSIILSTLVIGIIYGIVSGHIIESILGFLFINAIGVFFHKHSLMSPGDMKYLSTIMLFISLRNYTACGLLIAYMIIIGAIIGFIFYKKTGKNMKEDMKKQLFSYKALFVYRINTFPSLKFENMDEMLAKTIPFTLPMYLAYAFSVLTLILISIM